MSESKSIYISLHSCQSIINDLLVENSQVVKMRHIWSTSSKIANNNSLSYYS